MLGAQSRSVCVRRHLISALKILYLLIEADIVEHNRSVG